MNWNVTRLEIEMCMMQAKVVYLEQMLEALIRKVGEMEEQHEQKDSISKQS